MGPQAAHAGFHWRIWAAEAAGTALMVLAIVCAAALSLGEGSPLAEALPGPGARFLALGALVAPCIALIAISPLGRLSGAHINPAVTLAFWSLGWVSRHDWPGMWRLSWPAAWRARWLPVCFCRSLSPARSAAR